MKLNFREFVRNHHQLRVVKRSLEDASQDAKRARVDAPPAVETAHKTAAEIDALRAKNATKATKLALAFPHERDAHVFMDEGPHEYYVDGRSGRYQSVTTFIHKLFPEFEAELCVGRILRGVAYKNGTSKYSGQSAEEILAGWDANREEASRLGTEMHQRIEYFWNDMFDITGPDAQTREFEMFRAFLADYPRLRPMRTEWMVFHEELALSGSIDMVFQDPDGEPGVDVILYDWKRSKELKRPSSTRETGLEACTMSLKNCNLHHYTLQLNMYKYILEQKYAKRVSHMCLLFLHPRQDAYLRVQVEDWSKTLMPSIVAHRLAIASRLLPETQFNGDEPQQPPVETLDGENS